MILHDVNLENVSLGETVMYLLLSYSSGVDTLHMKNVNLLPLGKVIAELACFLSNHQYHL